MDFNPREIDAVEERDRLLAEIETLQRWHDELSAFLASGLQNAAVSQDEYSNAATMATRVLIRLKTLYDKVPHHRGNGSQSR